ncbi:MAG: hypothetical protein L6V95_00300 [Candidatus Melainabacteria bacterium]|nr:MAG: hypothetical protein L6V95_00300 [Candidatus Melainabacteria bacterium]
MIKTILVILPKSIAGSLILKGLGFAFNEIGFNVVIINIDDFHEDIIKKYNVQIVLGYDYSYLMDENVHKSLTQFKKSYIHSLLRGYPNKSISLRGQKY